jgi:fructose-bisphosphate aldolase, class I
MIAIAYIGIYRLCC